MVGHVKVRNVSLDKKQKNRLRTFVENTLTPFARRLFRVESTETTTPAHVLRAACCIANALRKDGVLRERPATYKKTPEKKKKKKRKKPEKTTTEEHSSDHKKKKKKTATTTQVAGDDLTLSGEAEDDSD